MKEQPATGGNRLAAVCGFLLVVGIVAWLGRGQVRFVFQLGNALSPIADAFSEACSLRAGENFAEHGFRSNKGLPDFAYGDQFPDAGVCKKSLRQGTTAVYTHYPPGPDWLAGLMTRLYGVGKLPYFRLAPIGLALASMLFLGGCLVRTLGPVPAVLALCALAWVPLFTNMMHGLSYQSYAFSLLLAELGVLLVAFHRRPLRPGMAVAALVVLGFLQGWFSFDYFFLVTLCAVPCWLLQYDRKPTHDLKRLVAYVLAPAFGFGCAHLLHFWQVAAYHGTVQAALGDFINVARWRASGDTFGARLSKDELYLLPLLKIYLDVLSTETYFNFSFRHLLGLMALLPLVAQAGIQVGRLASVRVSWTGERRSWLVLTTAFALSALWMAVMRNHSIIHLHYIPRHFFLFYFFCVLTVCRSLRVELGWVAFGELVNGAGRGRLRHANSFSGSDVNGTIRDTREQSSKP
jgi:hypothetical protein